MRSMFISGWKLSLLDDGITTIFLGLTFHRMANELFDQNSKCIWEFEAFKADLVDTISRIMMFHVLLHFATYLTKKVICSFIYICIMHIQYLYIYIYIFIYIYIYNT